MREFSSMTTIREIARYVRHSPGLERMDFIWDKLRKPYQRWLDRGRGAPVTLGLRHRIYVPGELAGTDWDSYEVKAAAAFGDWVKAHPGGFILDVGAAWGMYSALALTATSTTVVAIDSDLPSLARTRLVTQRSRPEGRLFLLHGLVSERSSVDTTIESLHSETLERLRHVSDDDPLIYRCLGDESARGLSTYALDDLVPALAAETPVLLKIDIEGAEVLALRGAKRLLQRPRTSVLLSVHPWLLPRYGHSEADVRAALQEGEMDRCHLIDKDHEEHWWCDHEHPMPSLVS